MNSLKVILSCLFVLMSSICVAAQDHRCASAFEAQKTSGKPSLWTMAQVWLQTRPFTIHSSYNGLLYDQGRINYRSLQSSATQSVFQQLRDQGYDSVANAQPGDVVEVVVLKFPNAALVESTRSIRDDWGDEIDYRALVSVYSSLSSLKRTVGKVLSTQLEATEEGFARGVVKVRLLDGRVVSLVSTNADFVAYRPLYGKY